jgi:hypothetical protein
MIVDETKAEKPDGDDLITRALDDYGAANYRDEGNL